MFTLTMAIGQRTRRARARVRVQLQLRGRAARDGSCPLPLHVQTKDFTPHI